MNASTDSIRTDPSPDCCLCGSRGQALYHGLEDRLFGVPGKWDLAQCSNRECGLIWLDPMPMPDDLVRLYVKYHTHHDTTERNSLSRSLYQRAIDQYLAQNYGYLTATNGALDKLLAALLYLHPARRAEADARVMHLPAIPDGRLLEIGFGRGETLKRLQSLGWNTVGVDFDPSAVANARAKGLDVHLGDVASQGFAANMFDAVVSSHVIEHVSNPLALMRECNRVLKPGGKLVVLTPNINSLGHRIFRTNWRGLEPPRHLHLFSTNALRKIAHDTGFVKVQCASTVRAVGIFLESLVSCRNNQSIRPRRTNRALTEVFHYIEWAACKLDKSAGEELLLSATKSELAAAYLRPNESSAWSPLANRVAC